MKTKSIGTLLIIFSLLGVSLALLTIFGVVPSEYVWGGYTGSGQELRALLVVSALVNLFFIWIVGMSAGIIPRRAGTRALKTILALASFLMLLNTLGNLLSHTLFEKYLALVTLCAAYLYYCLYKKV